MCHLYHYKYTVTRVTYPDCLLSHIKSMCLCVCMLMQVRPSDPQITAMVALYACTQTVRPSPEHHTWAAKGALNAGKQYICVMIMSLSVYAVLVLSVRSAHGYSSTVSYHDSPDTCI